jgi:hypothetical protein
METGMKTMLGGWEDVQAFSTQERAARPGSAEPFASVNLQRCVPVTPKGGSSPASTGRRLSLRRTQLGGVSLPLPPPLPVPERLAPRHATRQQALTRPALRAEIRRAHGTPSLARLALDETCEISDVDLVLLMDRPAPAQSPPVPHAAAGLRRGGTLVEPDLQVIPLPTRGLGRLVQRIVHWAKARLSIR